MTQLTPRELQIERLRDRIELGGRSANLAKRQLERLEEESDGNAVVLEEEDRSV